MATENTVETNTGIAETAAALMRGGDHLGAYDFVRSALEAGSQDSRLTYAAVLCLARSGATAFALKEYDRLGLAVEPRSEAVLALWARLLKDLAAQAGDGDPRILAARKAAFAYETVHRRFGGIYSLVNQATMLRVADDPVAAVKLARAALDLPTPKALSGDDLYYAFASRAEAYLLAGDEIRASQALAEAIYAAPLALSARASTLRQLQRICTVSGGSTDWLDRYRGPSCVHYTGPIFEAAAEGARLREVRLRQKMDDVLVAHSVGFAFGSLAAGADILWAEAVLAAGAELHVVLPLPEESFVRTSVAAFGTDWIARYRQCLSLARSVRFAGDDPYIGDDQIFTFSSQYAIGCAVVKAESLCSQAIQLAVRERDRHRDDGSVAADMAYWRTTGRPQVVLDDQTSRRRTSGAFSSLAGQSPSKTRTLKAMLFADFAGFGRLRGDQIPTFFKCVMGTLAAVVDRQGDAVIHRETWGDGVFLVFDSPEAAASTGLDLLDAHNELDLAGHGLPATLALRIGGHYGPVHLVENPLIKGRAVVGSHVVVAARIEPDAAPGALYVSESMAGALSTFPGLRLRCAYAGRTRPRKEQAPLSIFSVTRS